MAAWILPAAFGAASVVSSIFGGSKSAKAAKKALAELNERQARNDAWYRRKYNEDYADTSAGRNILRMAKDYARDNWQKAEGAAAVAGGTPEAAARAKEQGNKVIADSVSNLAAADTSRKDNLDASKRNMDTAISNQKMALEQQKAQAISNAAGQASNALAGAAVSTMEAKGASNSVEAPQATETAGQNGYQYVIKPEYQQNVLNSLGKGRENSAFVNSLYNKYTW